MTKKRILPPDRLAECEAAHALFLAKKNELKLSQKKIADEAHMTPAAVNLYFKGINPLNAQFAAVLARMLDEPIEAFSPRLAEEIQAMTRAPVVRKAPACAGGATAKMLEMIRSQAGKKLDLATQEKLEKAAMEFASEAASSVIIEDSSELRPRSEEILIPQYDIRAAMGHGQVPADYNEAVRNLVVREEILREKGVTYSSATALAMITGWGQSMEGTINDKDLVIVDRGINEFVGEGIYVVTWHQELYIKRMMRQDEHHFRLISDNPHYENQTARIDDVTIHAKVLLIWNARKA